MRWRSAREALRVRGAQKLGVSSGNVRGSFMWCFSSLVLGAPPVLVVHSLRAGVAVIFRCTGGDWRAAGGWGDWEHL